MTEEPPPADRVLPGQVLPADPPPAKSSAVGVRDELGMTSLGRGMLGAVLGLAGGSFVLRYVELAVLAAAVLAALILAAVSVVRPPRSSVELTLSPSAVTRGDEASLLMTVVNRSRKSSPPFSVRLPFGPVRIRRAGLAASSEAGAVPRDAGGVDVDVRPLRGYDSRDIEISLDTSVRGVLRLGPAQVRREDRFGLAFRRQRIGADVVLRVRPQVSPLAPLPAARSREPDGQAGHGVAGGLIFHTLREYSPGEDLRLVHWASSARMGELMVRTHVDPSEPAATIVLDTRPAAFPHGPIGGEVFEDAVDVAASVVVASARNSHGVRLITTGGVRATGRRRREDIEALLDVLAAVRPDPAASLDVVRTLRRGAVGTLIVVTGGYDREALTAAAAVAHMFGRVIVIRVGPRSPAAARARARRTRAARPRLRPVAPVVRSAGGGSWFASGGGRIGVTRSGGFRVLHVPTATELPWYWPASAQRAKVAGAVDPVS